MRRHKFTPLIRTKQRVPVVGARTFAVAALGAVILAGVLAAGPALVAARARPASLLRTE